MAERAVHQQVRLRGLAPLRIDATNGSGPWFLASPPQGWAVGRFHLPGPDDPEWWVLDLLREPVQLLTAPDHSLARVRGLSPSDFEPFPSLALPPGWCPRTEAVLLEQGLWSDPVRIKRYAPSCWELTEALQPTTVRPDWDPGLTGEALVVRRDLVECLLQQARLLAARFDDVELVS